MLTRLPILALALSAALAAPAVGSAADKPSQCVLGQIAEIPVTMRGLTPLVTVSIDGQPLTFILDSGAFFSAMTPEAAATLKLRAKPVPNFRVEGFTGGKDAETVTPRDFALGAYKARNMDFILTSERRFPPNVAGLLGQNIIGVTDVEYDLPHGTVRLFDPQNCGGQALAYWGGGYSVLPIEPISLRQMHIVGNLLVNGHKLRGMFDTGAGVSVVTTGGAAKAGVAIQADGVRAAEATGGAFGGNTESWVAPFQSVGLGDETVKNVRLQIARFSGALDVDMLMGADFFLSHRVYVAKSQNRLYFSYAGGPVFRFDAQGFAVNPDPASASTDKAPADADGFSRRGAASMSRRDYAQAVDDFTHAVDLEPKSAKHLVDRAIARLALGGKAGVQGLDDLEQALKLDPANSQALFARGRVRLAAHDETGARADFEAAIRAAPKTDNLELAVGQVYAGAGQRDDAISQFSAWIAAHPKDARLAEALNERCWTRAIAGRDLEPALADCEAAVKLERTAANLDSRAMTKLRLGRTDEAITDYDAALKLQPKQSLSLYARGVAKQRAGRKAEGQADIDAAKALTPAIEEQAKKIGLAP